jgi:hypothetical protein
VTYPQLIDKFREQAPLADISEAKQDQIVQSVTHTAGQESTASLIRNIVQ